MSQGAVQIVPTLTILEDEGDYIVNVGAQANAAALAQALVPVIAKLGGARRLSLITPSGIKSFKFNGANGNAPLAASAPAPSPVEGVAVRRSTIADSGAPPSEEDATADFERYVAEEQEAERVAREMETTNRANAGLPAEEEVPQAVKRRKASQDQAATPGASCGRCGGGGLLPGGGQCPVCRGKGTIPKWGRKKR